MDRNFTGTYPNSGCSLCLFDKSLDIGNSCAGIPQRRNSLARDSNRIIILDVRNK